MSERYKKIYALPANLYQADAPVIIKAGALQRDTVRNQLFVQLKFQNVTDKIISSLKVKIRPLDSSNEPIDCYYDYNYTDLNAKRNYLFGKKTPIWLNDSSTCCFEVYVENVVFSDDSIWQGENIGWKNSLPIQTLKEYFNGNQELVKQFHLETETKGKCVPFVSGNLWVCNCEAVNNIDEEFCSNCGKCLADMKASLNVDELTAKMETRLAEEEALAEQTRLENEKRAAEERAIKKAKNKKIIIISVAAALAVILAVVLVFSLYNMYANGEAKEQIDEIKAISMGFDSAERDAQLLIYEELLESYDDYLSQNNQYDSVLDEYEDQAEKMYNELVKDYDDKLSAYRISNIENCSDKDKINNSLEGLDLLKVQIEKEGIDKDSYAEDVEELIQKYNDRLDEIDGEKAAEEEAARDEAEAKAERLEEAASKAISIYRNYYENMSYKTGYNPLEYYIYDIDQGGIPELIILAGKSYYGDGKYFVYSYDYDKGELVKYGGFYGSMDGYTYICADPSHKGLILHYYCDGTEWAERITISGDDLLSKNIMSTSYSYGPTDFEYCVSLYPENY